jgi:signal transduction histidine kinase
VSAGSLRVRLLLAAAISILVALALAAFGLAFLFQRHVERWLDSQLEVQLDELTAGLRRAPAGGGIEVGKPPPDPRFEQPLSGLYWQIEPKPAGPVLRSRSLWDFEIVLPDIPVDASPHHARLPGPSGATLYVLMRHVALPATLGGGSALIAVALDASELKSAVWRFAGALAPLLLLVAALLIAASWVQVGVGLRPLAAMREALAGIRTGARKRLGQDFPDEVQPLAGEIDSLLGARESELERARARAADLAHGLKSHLQVLAGEASRLQARGVEDVGAEIEALAKGMQRHVERHLARARLAPPRADVSANIAETVARVTRVVERTPAGERLAWSVDVPKALNARIDPDDLAEALGNLIENAARHAASKVCISARRDGHEAVIVVADDGPGITEQARGRALERGVRLDLTDPGSGLGLAIVADIAEACGASLTLDNRPDGFAATLRLPAAG